MHTNCTQRNISVEYLLTIEYFEGQTTAAEIFLEQDSKHHTIHCENRQLLHSLQDNLVQTQFASDPTVFYVPRLLMRIAHKAKFNPTTHTFHLVFSNETITIRSISFKST